MRKKFTRKDNSGQKQNRNSFSSKREGKKDYSDDKKEKRDFSEKKFDKDKKYKREEKSDKDKKFDRDKKFDKRKKWDDDKKFNRDEKFDKNKKYKREEKSDKDKKFDRDKKFDKRKKWDDEKKFNREEKFDKDKKSSRDKKLDGDHKFDKNKKWDDNKKSSRDKKFDKKEDSDKDRKYSGKFERKFDRKKSSSKEEEGDFFNFDEYKEKKKRYSTERKKYDKLTRSSKKHEEKKADDGSVRLNKYLSNAGVCSRREADQLIISGVVKINGKVVTELGTKVMPGDKVSYGDQSLKREKMVYLVLNKPKDYITTSDDPQKRRTVMELVKGACKERIYPIGRLDRNTTGILIFTNDGELATKLMHPKFNVKKIYHVVTDQNVAKEDLDKLREGIELEDGFIRPDDIEYVGTGHNKKDIGLEIHSGRNRIVRRMFEELGYKVVKLDRVMFAGVSKKDVPRGKYRFLTPQEISFLKMI